MANKWWTPEVTRQLVMREVIVVVLCTTGVLIYFAAILLSGPITETHKRAFASDGAPLIYARSVPGGCLYESRTGLVMAPNACVNPEDLNP